MTDISHGGRLHPRWMSGHTRAYQGDSRTTDPSAPVCQHLLPPPLTAAGTACASATPAPLREERECERAASIKREPGLRARPSTGLNNAATNLCSSPTTQLWTEVPIGRGRVQPRALPRHPLIGGIATVRPTHRRRRVPLSTLSSSTDHTSVLNRAEAPAARPHPSRRRRRHR